MNYPPSELILNPDNSIYHLQLLPEDVADHVILVGDPDRVEKVSCRFDSVHKKVAKREFISHIGTLGGKPIMAISTGIGTDNIDIVINELDALVNIDLGLRKSKETKRKLRFYRIGTSGTIRPDVNVDEFIVSKYGVGLDGLAFFYQNNGREPGLENEIKKVISNSLPEVGVYASKASSHLVDNFAHLTRLRYGITLTLPGFYGPQGRNLRNPAKSTTFIDDIAKVRYDDLFVTNLEMETSGIFYLAKSLGHKAISFNAIIANRSSLTFSTDPHKTVDNLIELVLSNI